MNKSNYEYFMAYLPKNIMKYQLEEDTVGYELESPNNVHDKLFRGLLGDKKELAIFLNKYLNIDVKGEELEKYNSSFITDTFRNLEADTVYKIKGKKVFVLIEHQSSVDNSIPFRLLNYNNEIIKDTNEPYLYKTQQYIYAKVIPIVVYTGGKKWNVTKSFSTQQEKYGDKNYLEMKYNLIDINNYSKEELLQSDTIIEKAMLIEKSKKQEEIITTIDKILDTINYDDETQVRKILKIIRYALVKYLSRKNVEEFMAKINSKLKEEKGMNNILWDRIEEEKMQWKREAEKEGRIENIKATVRRMLEFGEDEKKIHLYTGASQKEINQIKKLLQQSV